jgi:drug/metabolite transporter (DMT)-like permease
MEKLNDLRYIIGLFFAIVGAVLVVLSYTSTSNLKTFGANLNLFAGGAMLVLGISLLWASGKPNKN